MSTVAFSSCQTCSRTIGHFSLTNFKFKKKKKNSGRNADAYRPRSVALELIGRHRGDGRAPATFVGNPVKRVLGRVLAIRPEAAPVQTIRKKN